MKCRAKVFISRTGSCGAGISGKGFALLGAEGLRQPEFLSGVSNY
jgi:hypothetical protein